MAEKKLNGTVNIESAKNSVLPILAGCVLTNDTVVINNCPKITDVLNMVKILKHIGAKAYFEKNNLIVNCSNICNSEIPKVLSKEIVNKNSLNYEEISDLYDIVDNDESQLQPYSILRILESNIEQL